MANNENPATLDPLKVTKKEGGKKQRREVFPPTGQKVRREVGKLTKTKDGTVESHRERILSKSLAVSL